MPPVAATIRVKVLFFGPIRELCGMSEESVQIPKDATFNDLFASYAVRYPKLLGFRSSLVASRNQELAAWDTTIGNDDEIAFLPPVSGG